MKRIIALTLAIATGTAAAFASEGAQVDAAQAEAITAKLSAQGFDVKEIEAEYDGFEVEAMKDGAEYELTLDVALNITETELEDDNSNDKD